MLLLEGVFWANIVGFCLTVFFNTVLEKLILSDASKNFGNYTKLMTANICNLVLFSFLQMTLNPVISIERNVLYVFTGIKNSYIPKIYIRVLMAMYGATYCMSLVLCAVKFVFRYDRVCRGNKLFSTTSQLLYWFLFILAIGIFWGNCIFFIAHETPYVDQIIRQPLLAHYNCSLNSTTYVAAVYEMEDQISGKFDWNFWGVVMGISFMAILLGSGAVILYCIRKLAHEMKFILGNQDVVQSELYNAQRMQTLLPFLLFFIPIISVLILPIFHINGNIGFSISSLLVAIFPILDPIAVIFSITQYREALWGNSGESSGYGMQQFN